MAWVSGLVTFPTRLSAGIIASKRCNNVQIYNNTVYDNDEVSL